MRPDQRWWEQASVMDSAACQSPKRQRGVRSRSDRIIALRQEMRPAVAGLTRRFRSGL